MALYSLFSYMQSSISKAFWSFLATLCQNTMCIKRVNIILIFNISNWKTKLPWLVYFNDRSTRSELPGLNNSIDCYFCYSLSYWTWIFQETYFYILNVTVCLPFFFSLFVILKCMLWIIFAVSMAMITSYGEQDKIIFWQNVLF